MGRPPTGHSPERQCRVCRIRQPKAQLERWVITSTGLVLDSDQALPGRGWYACSKPSCSRHITQAITGQAKKSGHWPKPDQDAIYQSEQQAKSMLNPEANSA